MTLADLTRREREVLELLADGWTDKEIAKRLGCAYDTERTYVRQLYAKLGVHNRVEAARFLIIESAA